MTEKAFVKDIPPERDDERLAFINESGWGDAEIKPLSEDAGSRRYFELTKSNGDRALMMDMPFAFLKLREFILIGDALKAVGLKTPDFYALNLDKGFSIIEHLGDRCYADLFDQGEDKEPYILKAMDVLIHLHQNIDVSKLKPQLMNDIEWYKWELPSFTDWYYPAYHGHETPPDITSEFMALWSKQLDSLPELGFETLSMIDYHAPNLIDRPDAQGIEHVGVIDFQDGVITSPAYDVMTLLEDDRRDLEPKIREKALQRYLDAMKGAFDAQDFIYHMNVLSAQRHCKNMGNFTRIVVQKYREIFLDYMQHCIHWFDQSIQTPELAPIKSFMDRHCPDYKTPLKMDAIRKWKI